MDATYDRELIAEMLAAAAHGGIHLFAMDAVMGQIAALRAADNRDAAGVDSEEDAYVIERMGKLLAEIAVIVNGPEPDMTRWSYHDLPEKVRALKTAPDAATVGEAVAYLDIGVGGYLDEVIGNATLYLGDCIETMRRLPAGSVQTCVTSPPYFGLRDYGHEGQIGLEPTPDEFVAALVAVFREVRRVLRDDGTLWLNLGDSYGSKGGDIFTGFNARYSGTGLDGGKQAAIAEAAKGARSKTRETGLRAKNLIGIPWRVAFALQADGWYLRQDIIWHKPNPMPESVRDRCTKAHEYIFLLSKGPRYYFDYEAIKEPAVGGQTGRAASFKREDSKRAQAIPGQTVGTHRADRKDVAYNGESRNKRSVWTVATRPFNGAHFATFPPDLIEPCILAGCPRGGTVLDPFGGAGTTGLVAERHGRNAILCELNPEYAALAQARIEDARPKLPPTPTPIHPHLDMFEGAAP